MRITSSDFGVLQQPLKEGGRGGKDGASGLPIWNLPKISSEREREMLEATVTVRTESFPSVFCSVLGTM